MLIWCQATSTYVYNVENSCTNYFCGKFVIFLKDSSMDKVKKTKCCIVTINIDIFTVTFDQLKISLLNKSF